MWVKPSAERGNEARLHSMVTSMIKTTLALVFACLLATGGTLPAQGRIVEIPGHWKPEGLRRLSVARVVASSIFGDPDGQYAARRAIDGDRGTKWVASVEPSREKPQWITLELAAPQPVAAVAVFGEAVGNDGIQDGQIQVAGAKPDEFVTVASIENGKWGRWLATFTPVKTSAVRLLITRSYPPSPNTDIYEVELQGPPLSSLAAAEVKTYAGRSLDACRIRLAPVATLDRQPQAVGALELRQSVGLLQEELDIASERFAQWDGMDAARREDLVGKIERLLAAAQQIAPCLERARSVWPVRHQEILAARQSVAPADSAKVTAVRDGPRVRLANDRVVVRLDERDGTWDATWLSPVDAAIRRIGFSVHADKQDLAAKGTSATTEPFADKLGTGVQIRQRWAGSVEIERYLRLYDGRPAVVVLGQVTNKSSRDVTLGEARMAQVGPETRGWWHLGRLVQTPAAVGYPGVMPPCRPASGVDVMANPSQSYYASGSLALSCPQPDASLTIGYLAALEGSPQIQAGFRLGDGGTSLSAVLAYGGRILPAGQSIAIEPLWISAEASAHAGLERYGDAVAAFARQPVRTGANSLWCSWYPIRMGISEEIVFANAAVAAAHFKPLGLDLIQLDHGWQRGDICGDWVPNQRFPHGLKWLSDQLRSRYGMKLGLWIAPTVVAETSQLYREHPDWMLKNPDGKPAPAGRWYWVPNPECYTLDASHPAAAKWIEQTFARLTAEGASYFKIDFIAGSGGGYVQHDPQCTRGWGVLRRGMEAIRRGAGPEAWIRYCQTPALLSAGLANSAYIGDDTGDAGLEGGINLLRINAQLLAASYWLNDRLYHREVCDMSVGMKAPVEEARLRLALMTMTGCSISFSDDFRLLPLPRIRMVQQCLPPGNPPARPLDLFFSRSHAPRGNARGDALRPVAPAPQSGGPGVPTQSVGTRIPSLWHMHCKKDFGEWDVVGVFNFESRPEERTVEFGALGLAPGTKAAVFEFWESKLLGRVQDRMVLTVPPESSRILVIRRLSDRPQVIATDMHLLGGYHEIQRLAWDETRRVLSGQYHRAPGLSGKVFLHVPKGYRPRADASQGIAAIQEIGEGLWVQNVEFKGADVDWSIAFDL